jgi:hypothetical protein
VRLRSGRGAYQARYRPHEPLLSSQLVFGPAIALERRLGVTDPLPDGDAGRPEELAREFDLVLVAAGRGRSSTGFPAE